VHVDAGGDERRRGVGRDVSECQETRVHRTLGRRLSHTSVV
jgi:hypothetical protein